MRVAVSSDGPGLKARVGHRLGLSPYLLIVDLASDDFEVVRSPGDSRSGGGMQVVALIIANKCQVLLTGYCSPMAEHYLSTHGVEVVAGLGGTIEEILEQYKRENLETEREKSGNLGPITGKIDRRVAANAVQNAFHQIRNLLPVMVSVVFLVGLFNTFISGEFLTSLFTGSMWWDSFRGAVVGSVFAGNPINSYIIGGQLLKQGVSLVAVTAFLCSWVSVGLLQLPAEIAALGWRFAVVRNISCFGLSIAISLVMMLILKLFGM